MCALAAAARPASLLPRWGPAQAGTICHVHDEGDKVTIDNEGFSCCSYSDSSFQKDVLVLLCVPKCAHSGCSLLP